MERLRLGTFAVDTSGKVSTMGVWGGRGAIFFIGTLLDVFEVIDCVRVCCERNVDWNKLEAHSKV